MSTPNVPVERRVQDALDLSTRPLEVETFAELFDSVQLAEVIGPDSDDIVWLHGVDPASGTLRAVNLGESSNALARAALRWRETQRGRDVRH
jgi:hypothetical protein